VVRVGDMVQRTGDGRTGQVLGSRVIKMSGDAVRGLHRERGDEEHMCSWLGLKIKVDGL
jgi:hypothetical protein